MLHPMMQVNSIKLSIGRPEMFLSIIILKLMGAFLLFGKCIREYIAGPFCDIFLCFLLLFLFCCVLSFVICSPLNGLYVK